MSPPFPISHDWSRCTGPLRYHHLHCQSNVPREMPDRLITLSRPLWHRHWLARMGWPWDDGTRWHLIGLTATPRTQEWQGCDDHSCMETRGLSTYALTWDLHGESSQMGHVLICPFLFSGGLWQAGPSRHEHKCDKVVTATAGQRGLSTIFVTGGKC
jgi:hypothetical protein